MPRVSRLRPTVSNGVFNHFNRFHNLLEREPTQPASREEWATVGVA